MLQVIFSIAFVIALIRNIHGLRQEKDFFIADEKGKDLFAPVTLLPLLYLVAFALAAVPLLPLPALLVIFVFLFIPGVLVTRKAKLVFETGNDKSFKISKQLGVLYAIGLAGMAFTVGFPLLFLLFGSLLLD